MLNMMRSLGLIFGIDISGMLFMSVATMVSPGTATKIRGSSSAMAFLPAPAFMDGFHVVMLTLIGIALLSTVLSFLRGNEGRRTRRVHVHEPIELM